MFNGIAGDTGNSISYNLLNHLLNQLNINNLSDTYQINIKQIPFPNSY